VSANRQIKKNLGISVAGLGAFFALLLYIFNTRILRPLRVMELTTTRIAGGNFQKVEVRKANDEIRHVQEAFNCMVDELKKRQYQLIQTQKLSSIGLLSAGIAHQVNNPLNNIFTSSQLLREALGSTLKSFHRKMLDNIDNETTRAGDIVRGLLDFARGGTAQSLHRVQLQGVTDKVARLVSPQIPCGVTLDVNIGEDIELDLDPRRMTEALLNLTINAVQSIEKTPGFIRLYTDTPAPEGMVSLVVEDSGEGICGEDLPQIFDPFFTRKGIGKGTGLGLSVVYGIVKDCGGHIRAESEPGKGTRFIIDLPLPLEALGERGDMEES